MFQPSFFRGYVKFRGYKFLVLLMVQKNTADRHQKENVGGETV